MLAFKHPKILLLLSQKLRQKKRDKGIGRVIFPMKLTGRSSRALGAALPGRPR